MKRPPLMRRKVVPRRLAGITPHWSRSPSSACCAGLSTGVTPAYVKMVTSRLRRKPSLRAKALLAKITLSAVNSPPRVRTLYGPLPSMDSTGLSSVSQTFSGRLSASPRISAAGCTKTLFME
ncbi:Uncharacterised protein [Bordetella pertussis]|nr:Uncharacterised protein [Bordetella pertussis]